MSRRPWSSADIDFMRANYQRMTVPALAERLDRSEVAIKSMAQTLGIARHGRKGCVPWNKGTTYTIKRDVGLKPTPIPRPTLGPWGCVW